MVAPFRLFDIFAVIHLVVVFYIISIISHSVVISFTLTTVSIVLL